MVLLVVYLYNNVLHGIVVACCLCVCAAANANYNHIDMTHRHLPVFERCVLVHLFSLMHTVWQGSQ